MRITLAERKAMPPDVWKPLNQWLWRTGVFFKTPHDPRHWIPDWIDIQEGVITGHATTEGTSETRDFRQVVTEPPPVEVIAWLREREEASR